MDARAGRTTDTEVRTMGQEDDRIREQTDGGADGRVDGCADAWANARQNADGRAGEHLAHVRKDFLM